MDSEPLPTPSVSAMLDQLWAKFRPQVEERIEVLEQAAAALALDNLSSQLRAEAHSAAHKLAGTLGMFGLDNGTAIAREAESFLAGQAPLEAPNRERLAPISAELRSIVLNRP